MKYPKSFRLLTRRSFLMRGQLQRMGRFLIIDMRKTTRPHARLGLTVSKKYGHAVERNRFKRLVREAFRLSPTCILLPFDLNIRPRTFAKDASFSDIQGELRQLLTEVK